MSQGITSHGVGLNCDTDLSWYEHIVPCGVSEPGAGVTSLTEVLQRRVTVEETVPIFCESFSRVFKLPVVMQPPDDVVQ